MDQVAMDGIAENDHMARHALTWSGMNPGPQCRVCDHAVLEGHRYYDQPRTEVTGRPQAVHYCCLVREQAEESPGLFPGIQAGSQEEAQRIEENYLKNMGGSLTPAADAKAETDKVLERLGLKQPEPRPKPWPRPYGTPWKLTRIISGGQTGADRGGLDAAISAGLDYGGTLPLGRKAEDGQVPALYEGMAESKSERYADRTLANVQDSDATIIFVGHRGSLAGGSKLTVDLCRRRSKPFLVVRLLGDAPLTESATVVWIVLHKVTVLNIAGQRQSHCPALQQRVETYMLEILRRLAGGLCDYEEQTSLW